MYQVVGLFLVF